MSTEEEKKKVIKEIEKNVKCFSDPTNNGRIKFKLKTCRHTIRLLLILTSHYVDDLEAES